MDSDDPKLDALLKRAAPDGAPPGFADGVIAAAGGRRRQRRLRLALLGAAAVVAACLCLYAARGSRPDDDGVVRVKVPDLAGSRDAIVVEAAATESFAVQLAPICGRGQRVMMARINDTYMIRARPNDDMADELEELLRVPTAKAGVVSAACGRASMAASFK